MENEAVRRPILSLKTPRKRKVAELKKRGTATRGKKRSLVAFEASPDEMKELDLTLAQALHELCAPLEGIHYRVHYFSNTHVRVQVSLRGDTIVAEAKGIGKEKLKHLAVNKLYPEAVSQIAQFIQDGSPFGQQRRRTVVAPEAPVEVKENLDLTLAEYLHGLCGRTDGVRFKAVYLNSTHVRAQVSFRGGECLSVEERGIGKKKIKHRAINKLYPEVAARIAQFIQDGS